MESLAENRISSKPIRCRSAYFVMVVTGFLLTGALTVQPAVASPAEVAVASPAEVAVASSPEGKWSGQWRSEATGHQGPLKARIRKLDNDRYRAMFRGRFFAVIPFIYPTTLQRSGDSSFTSSQRLPLLGTYKMKAEVTSDQFKATFEGRRDTGVFELSR